MSMDEEDELPEGETIEIDAEFEEVEDTPDGGAIITIGEDDEEEGESDHNANLAETLPEHELQAVATKLVQLIEQDKKARQLRDKQYEEGLRRTGLGNDAPGGADFEGASKVVHPLMTEACVDFAARAMKEIFPPGGPAKDNVVEPATPNKLDKAKRKTRLLNWQMTVQCPEVRAELEQLMTQVPLGGSQYLKLGWDHERNRPTFLFVPVDEMYLPFSATNFYSSQRKTHAQLVTDQTFRERIEEGMYRNLDMAPASMDPEESVALKANDKIEGRESDGMNVDGTRTIYEVTVQLDVEGFKAPYLVSIDEPSGRILAIYRNWAEGDESLEELTWYIEWPFIPWRGVYAIGFPHIIGGLSGAATGALRALLDAAHVANSQTMVMLKGNMVNGQTQKVQPGQTVEIEGNLNTDDIRKVAMQLPYPQPSPVLFQLLGFLVDAGKGVVRSSLDDTADMNPNAPVGTTLARIEQGAVVYSAIHARLHDAMARMLRALDRLNGLYLDDEMLEKEAGDVIASREDFDGVLDVVPVSDPNIFSEAQRYAQVQAVAQRAAALPQLYNARKVEERLLDTLKIPNAKELLNPPIEPHEQNAVNENVAASLGRPITAFPDQDHIAHLKTHLAYMESAAFGMNPLIAPQLLPIMLNHLKEHIAMWYVASTVQIAGEALGGADIIEMMEDMEEEPEARQHLDRMLAEASLAVISDGAQVFDDLPQVIAKAQQMMMQLAQANQPQMPPDPRLQIEQAKIEQTGAIKQAEMQQKSQTEGQKLALEAQKLQIKAAEMQQKAEEKMREEQRLAQKDQADVQLDAAKLEQDAQLKGAELQVRVGMNDSDNQTAKEITAAKIAAGQSGNLSTGTGINPQP
jgi:chaperonin GroES